QLIWVTRSILSSRSSCVFRPSHFYSMQGIGFLLTRTCPIHARTTLRRQSATLQPLRGPPKLWWCHFRKLRRLDRTGLQCPNLGHHGRSLQTVTPDSDPGSSPASRRMDSAVRRNDGQYTKLGHYQPAPSLDTPRLLRYS